MSTIQQLQADLVDPVGRCANCGTHGETEKWYGDGGALAVSHGFYRWWCRRCILAAQLEYARAQAARASSLETQLAALEP